MENYHDLTQRPAPVLPKTKIKRLNPSYVDKERLVFDSGMLRVTELINKKQEISKEKLERVKKTKSMARLVDSIVSDGLSDYEENYQNK